MPARGRSCHSLYDHAVYKLAILMSHRRPHVACPPIRPKHEEQYLPPILSRYCSNLQRSIAYCLFCVLLLSRQVATHARPCGYGGTCYRRSVLLYHYRDLEGPRTRARAAIIRQAASFQVREREHGLRVGRIRAPSTSLSSSRRWRTATEVEINDTSSTHMIKNTTSLRQAERLYPYTTQAPNVIPIIIFD